MPKTDEKELEQLFHLVLSRDEVLVLLLGMIAVGGCATGQPMHGFQDMTMEYLKLRLTTDADLTGGLDRLKNKLETIANALEKS